MALKKRAVKKKPSKGYNIRSAKKRPPYSQLVRSVFTLVILLLVLGAAGVMARHMLERKISLEPSNSKSLQLPERQNQPTTRSPEYEIFPAREMPPVKESPPKSDHSLALKVVPDPVLVKPVKRLKQRRKSDPPLVAVIIDDIGYDSKIVDLFLSIDAPLTFSVLPYSPFQKKVAAKIRAKHQDLMLHLPMEPVEFPRVNPGPGALLTTMSTDQLTQQLVDALDTLPGAVGVNNHMGSRLTTDSVRMRRILSILKNRGLFFIDSRTSYQSVTGEIARKLNLPYARRHVFLDNDADTQKINIQFRKLIWYAQKYGEAVGIAHPHKETYRVLARELPKLKGTINVVPASILVRVPG